MAQKNNYDAAGFIKNAEMLIKEFKEKISEVNHDGHEPDSKPPILGDIINKYFMVLYQTEFYKYIDCDDETYTDAIKAHELLNINFIKILSNYDLHTSLYQIYENNSSSALNNFEEEKFIKYMLRITSYFSAYNNEDVKLCKKNKIFHINSYLKQQNLELSIINNINKNYILLNSKIAEKYIPKTILNYIGFYKDNMYLLTNIYSFDICMKYIEDRQIRKQIYNNYYLTDKKKLMNLNIYSNILSIRKNTCHNYNKNQKIKYGTEAKYKNYYEMKIGDNLLSTIKECDNLVTDIIDDFDNLYTDEINRIYKVMGLNESDQINDYDIVHYYNKIKDYIVQKRFNNKINIKTYNDLCKYFPFNSVLTSLFEVVEEIFQIKFILSTTTKKHNENILIYGLYNTEIYKKTNNLQDSLIGTCYFDLFNKKYTDNEDINQKKYNYISDDVFVYKNMCNLDGDKIEDIYKNELYTTIIFCNFNNYAKTNEDYYMDLDDVTILFKKVANLIHIVKYNSKYHYVSNIYAQDELKYSNIYYFENFLTSEIFIEKLLSNILLTKEELKQNINEYGIDSFKNNLIITIKILKDHNLGCSYKQKLINILFEKEIHTNLDLYTDDTSLIYKKYLEIWNNIMINAKSKIPKYSIKLSNNIIPIMNMPNILLNQHCKLNTILLSEIIAFNMYKYKFPDYDFSKDKKLKLIENQNIINNYNNLLVNGIMNTSSEVINSFIGRKISVLVFLNNKIHALRYIIDEECNNDTINTSDCSRLFTTNKET